MSRRRVLHAAGALGLAALLPGCATERFVAQPGSGKAGPMAPPPQPGQRWRYAEIDLYRNARRDELDLHCTVSGPGEIRIAGTHADGRRRDDEVWRDASHIIEDPSFGALQIFAEPVPVLPTPLQAGVRQQTRTFWHTKESPDFPLWWTDWLSTPGWQRIRVPAGEFVALRIERLIRFRDADIWRLDCQRLDTCWYVPELRRWAARQWLGEWRMPDEKGTIVDEDRVRWELLEVQPALEAQPALETPPA